MVLTEIISIFLHLDQYLDLVIQQYGVWVYLILFLIIFIETGIVIFPFLPGDSLLFAVGAFAALGSLNLLLVILLLSFAAVLGDSVNYWLGHRGGRRIFSKEKSFLFSKKYLTLTEKFYNKHGGKTIIIARFLPIIRTFAPFVAGMGSMNYIRFLAYNVIGGLLWVFIFVLGGFFFGNIPIVKENFTLVIIAIIVLSLVPMIIKLLMLRRNNKKENSNPKRVMD